MDLEESEDEKVMFMVDDGGKICRKEETYIWKKLQLYVGETNTDRKKERIYVGMEFASGKRIKIPACLFVISIL